MGLIGYFEGTDPLVLANLSIVGHSTMPLGNGFDNHGKYVGHITKDDNVSVVVGYFHKIMPSESGSLSRNAPKRQFLICLEADRHLIDLPIDGPSNRE
jgi:hypothetical protein